MKPLTKIAVNRGGGIAARFALADPTPQPKVKPKLKAKAAPEKRGNRVERWRAANPELYRERQRVYQQAYRKRKKEAS